MVSVVETLWQNLFVQKDATSDAAFSADVQFGQAMYSGGQPRILGLAIVEHVSRRVYCQSTLVAGVSCKIENTGKLVSRGTPKSGQKYAKG